LDAADHSIDAKVRQVQLLPESVGIELVQLVLELLRGCIHVEETMMGMELTLWCLQWWELRDADKTYI